MKSHPELISQHLSRLVPTVITMATDREVRIRSLARPLIGLILSQVDAESVEPLYNSMCAILCCGLSHINSDIQLDSLKLLDDLVTTLPHMAAAKHDLLLPNCLDQVSFKSGGGKSNLANRSLISNVNEKVTALQWRTTVLKRVHGIMRLILEKQSRMDDCQTKISKDGNEDHYMELCETFDQENCLSLTQILEGYKMAKYGLNEQDSSGNFKMNSFIQGLIPILIETWCEALGTSTKKHENRFLIMSSYKNAEITFNSFWPLLQKQEFG